ncbi:MAG: biotin--[acetyl-CoA-carboxylase] ligase [Deltaproteobacteria bacterium]|nr:biotin--[acetyl-CoA-carboxylase] ligase [Deltaproteobacteria bacterium]
MRVLYDDVAALRALLGERPAPAPPCGATLSDPEQRLWEALAPGHPVGATIAPDAGRFSTLAIVAEAQASQLDLLNGWVREGAAPGRAVAAVAVTGRGFHGQRQRSWLAPPGTLYLSVAAPLAVDLQRAAPALTMLPCVAVCDAVRALSQGAVAAGTKWVNDVLIEGGKVAGALTLLHSVGVESRAVLFGVGLNVAVAPPVPPTRFVPAVSALRQWLPAVELAPVLGAVLQSLSARLAEIEAGELEAIGESYRDHSVVIGRAVELWDEGADADTRGKPFATGVVDGIDADLRLRLRGRAEPIGSGRLVLVG